MAIRDIYDHNGEVVAQLCDKRHPVVFLAADKKTVIGSDGEPIKSTQDTVTDLKAKRAALEAQIAELAELETTAVKAEEAAKVELDHNAKVKALSEAGKLPTDENGKQVRSKEAVAAAYEALKASG